MKRLIKFRGKRTDTGEWIYGDLLTSNGTECEISDWNDVVYSRYDVDHETVGQFTGLLDKNGKEIYEGDILSVCNGSINCFPCMDKPYPVEYKINKGFIMPMFLWDKDGNDCSNNTHWCEVIGNVHDNPELLKGGKE